MSSSAVWRLASVWVFFHTYLSSNFWYILLIDESYIFPITVEQFVIPSPEILKYVGLVTKKKKCYNISSDTKVNSVRPMIPCSLQHLKKNWRKSINIYTTRRKKYRNILYQQAQVKAARVWKSRKLTLAWKIRLLKIWWDLYIPLPILFWLLKLSGKNRFIFKMHCWHRLRIIPL